MAEPTLPNQASPNKHVVLTIVAVVALILVGLFSLRVILIYQKIVSGETDDLSLNFTDKLTTSRAVSALEDFEGEYPEVATDDDPYLGSVDAPIKIVEFADFGCEYSKEVSYDVRRLAAQYPEIVQVIFRDFPLTDIHPGAQMAAEAGECAHEQGKFWEYHDKIFQNQSDLSFDILIYYAAQIGLDVNGFQACLERSRYRSEVLDDYAAGVQAGVYGTPTFFFNGYRVEGAIPYDIFELIISSLITEEL